MKGDISIYKEEIEKFFKSKHIEIIIDSREFQSHTNKSEQCCINLKVKNKNSIYGNIIGHFELITMPGCCGIVISTNCWVHKNLQGFKIGDFLHKLRIKIAKDWGYTILMCTDVDTNVIQKHILNKNGWKQIQQFKNSRTNNIVNIHTLHL